MKCPHCEYQDVVWDTVTGRCTDGNKGSFYTLSGESVMHRHQYQGWRPSEDTKQLVGCPSCMKTFID